MVANLQEWPRHLYTLEEYFALERTGDARYEFWDGDIICMSGGSQRHARISGNVYFSLRQQLSGRPCEAFTSDLPIKTPLLQPYRYPNVSVVCGEAEIENIEGIEALTNPTLIVEVLSPATESRDRHEKRAAYQALPSTNAYLLLSQDAPHVTCFLRHESEWVRSDYGDLNVTIELPFVDCELALSDVYQGVEFE